MGVASSIYPTTGESECGEMLLDGELSSRVLIGLGGSLPYQVCLARGLEYGVYGWLRTSGLASVSSTGQPGSGVCSGRFILGDVS